MGPRETLAGRLAALGFADTDGARRVLSDQLKLDADGADAELVTALAAAADPDQALSRLAALGDDKELIEALRADQGLRDRLVAVLGVSAALADHLRRHKNDWRLLASPAADAAPAAEEITEELLAATDDQSRPSAARADALRTAYRRRLLLLAARDLTGTASLDEVMAELADLSGA